MLGVSSSLFRNVVRAQLGFNLERATKSMQVLNLVNKKAPVVLNPKVLNPKVSNPKVSNPKVLNPHASPFTSSYRLVLFRHTMPRRLANLRVKMAASHPVQIDNWNTHWRNSRL